MSSELQIPASAVEPLEVLLELSDQEFSTLMSVLDDQGAADLQEISQALAPKLPDLRIDAGELVGTFVSLDLFRETRGWSASEASELIAHAPSSPGTTAEEVARLRARIAALLEADCVVVMAGTLKGTLASERVFEDVDVVTDVRPVTAFGTYSRLPVVILHNVRLTYRTQGRSESLYVTLDELDLEQLERAIAAARRSAAELADALAETRLQPTGSPWRRG
jgi:uncharacterized protein YhdP